jgi:hypothetical protein
MKMTVAQLYLDIRIITWEGFILGSILLLSGIVSAYMLWKQERKEYDCNTEELGIRLPNQPANKTPCSVDSITSSSRS